MSVEHLRVLRKSLEDNYWVVDEELPGNDYNVSAYWKISRPNGDSSMCLEFAGLDDLETFPIEKAYACTEVGKPEVSCYFGKVSKSFAQELSNFIEGLSSVST